MKIELLYHRIIESMGKCQPKADVPLAQIIGLMDKWSNGVLE